MPFGCSIARFAFISRSGLEGLIPRNRRIFIGCRRCFMRLCWSVRLSRMESVKPLYGFSFSPDIDQWSNYNG
jgi:hypothetical protein